ncbi:MAG: hypothetical protein P1T08_07390 [Acidimicrobiia bacterium]|nr:hypothetical protein [Acidimicrobiia bacterium]
MKRLARTLAFTVAIAAGIWAMRDRFLSLALPREPQPPAFRHPDDHPDVPHRPHQVEPTVQKSTQQQPARSTPDDLTAIKGIGPVFASKLSDIGITTFKALAAAAPGDTASKLDTSESRLADWIDQAQQRA